MPRVICTLPNTDADLDGLAWERQDDGTLLSPDLPDDRVARYLTIDGFREEPAKVPEPVSTAPPQEGASPAGTSQVTDATASSTTESTVPAAGEQPITDAADGAAPVLPLGGRRARAASTPTPATPASTEQPKE